MRHFFIEGLELFTTVLLGLMIAGYGGAAVLLLYSEGPLIALIVLGLGVVNILMTGGMMFTLVMIRQNTDQASHLLTMIARQTAPDTSRRKDLGYGPPGEL